MKSLDCSLFANLINVKWYLSVISILIYLIMSKVWHLFIRTVSQKHFYWGLPWWRSG